MLTALLFLALAAPPQPEAARFPEASLVGTCPDMPMYVYLFRRDRQRAGWAL